MPPSAIEVSDPGTLAPGGRVQSPPRAWDVPRAPACGMEGETRGRGWKDEFLIKEIVNEIFCP